MNKALKITLIVAAALVALYFGAQWFLSWKLRQIIDDKLPELTEGKYDAHVGKVKVCLINRSVRLMGITVRSLDNEGADFTELTVGRIALNGIGYRSRDGKRRLTLSSIRVNSPTLSALVGPSEARAGDTTAKVPLDQQIFRTFSSISVRKIMLTDGNVNYSRHEQGDTLTYILTDAQLRTSGFLLSEQTDPGKIFYNDDITVEARTFLHRFDHSSTELRVDGIKAGARNESLQIESFKLIPLYEKDRYAWIVPGHPDWTQVTITGISVAGLDLKGIQQNETIRAREVTISGGEIESYKNRKINRVEKRKPIIHETLYNLPFTVDIGKINIHNLKATYDELAVNGSTPGVIYFTDLEGVMTDVYNRPRPGNPHYRLDARGMLMGRGAVHAVFVFPTVPQNGPFTVDATLGAMPLTAINPVLEPLAFLRILSGNAKSLKMHSVAGLETATTSLTLLYDDLDVMIEKNDEGHVWDRKGLSWVANQIVIKDANPDRWGTRSTQAYTARDHYRSQFNYLWKMILPGLKESAGIPDANARTENDENAYAANGRPPVRPEGLLDNDDKPAHWDKGLIENVLNSSKQRKADKPRRRERRRDNPGVQPQGIFDRD